MDTLIYQLRDLHLPEIFFVASVILVLIDYFFRTDWPCHIGYFLFAAAIFIVLDALWPTALVIGLAVWLLLLILHFFLFKRFLTNAPGKNPGEFAYIPEGDDNHK